MASINEHESAQIDRANASGKPPVMFIHGLWLLPTSWEPWAELFERHPVRGSRLHRIDARLAR